MRCLEILYQGEAVLPRQLAAKLGLTTGSVTVMLDHLERWRDAQPIHPTAAARLSLLSRRRPLEGRQRSTVQSRGEGERRVLSRYTAAELRVLLDFLSVEAVSCRSAMSHESGQL